MKRLGAVIGAAGLALATAHVVRDADEPQRSPASATTATASPADPGAAPEVHHPVAWRPPRLPPAVPRERPAAPVTATDAALGPAERHERYVDALGGVVIDVIEQCLAEHDNGLRVDVSVDYRLEVADDAAWIVVEAPSSEPAIAAVEDCVADRLARAPADVPPDPARAARTELRAGVSQREERRIFSMTHIEWQEPDE